MSILKTFAVSAATTIILGAGAAGAATYTVERTNDDSLFSFRDPVMTTISQGGTTIATTQIGGYANTATNDDGTWDFIGWCVDVFTPYRHGGATSKAVGTYETSSSEPRGVGLAGPGRFDLVESFFDKVYDPVRILGSEIMAGAFQLAIWEILYETGPGYSLTKGAVQATEHKASIVIGGRERASSLATEQATWDAATQLLAEFRNWKPEDGFTDWDFTYFTAADGREANQTLLTVLPPDELPEPPSEVPLPAPALLLLGGIAALGAMKRRRA